MAKRVEKRYWALFNVTGRGQPILVPGSVFDTKGATLRFRDEYPFRRDFVPRPITLTYETGARK